MGVKRAIAKIAVWPTTTPQKRGVASGPFHEERDDENAEHTSIEQRSHFIHRFDQRAEVGREVGEGHGVGSQNTVATREAKR